MDKFVIRNHGVKSWKAMTITSINEKIQSETTKKTSTLNINSPKIKPRFSLMDETLLKIFNSKPDQPLSEVNSVNETSEIFLQNNENVPPSNDFTRENIPLVSRSESPVNLPLVMDTITPKGGNFLLSRIQRDMNSPSAATRLRAIRAMKSPTRLDKYTNFDVPHEMQDIITEEERNTTNRPATIQEVMKNVCVYVEVRTGEDNRSAGIKQVIALLGAHVNDKLLRNTTHVIFKDGLLSTYNKAKRWNIPIVSILWIEACKKHLMLMNPTYYPIANSERYENPELYKRMRRPKSMQPNAEDDFHSKKTKSSNSTTPNNNSITYETPSNIRVPQKQDNRLEKILLDFQSKLDTPEDDECFPRESKLLQIIREIPLKDSNDKSGLNDNNICDENEMKTDKKTNLVRKSLFGDNDNTDMDNNEDRNISSQIVAQPKRQTRRNSMQFTAKSSKEDLESNVTITSNRVTRRNSMQFTPQPINDPPIIESVMTPHRVTRRNSMQFTSSIHDAVSMDLEAVTPSRHYTTRRASINTYSPSEIEVKHDIQGNNRKTVVKKVANKNHRKTMFTPKMTEVKEDDEINGIEILNDNKVDIDNQQTIFSSISMDYSKTTVVEKKIETDDAQDATLIDSKLSCSNNMNMTSPVVRNITKRETMFSPQMMEQSTMKTSLESQISYITPITNKNRRRTLYTPNDVVALSKRQLTEKKTQLIGNSYQSTPINTTMASSSSCCMDETPPVVSQKTLITEFDKITTPNMESKLTNGFSAITPIITKSTGKTLLEEYSHTFSSTRKVMSAKRKTMFDISMEILDQRLQNINKNAKINKSLNETNEKIVLPPAIETTRKSNVVEVNKNATILANGKEESSGTLSKKVTIHSFYQENKMSSISEESGISKTNSVQVKTTVMATKKRKLFAPPETYGVIPQDDDENLKKKPPIAPSKRQRDIEDETTSNKQKKQKLLTQSTPFAGATVGKTLIKSKSVGKTITKINRRSTLDFVDKSLKNVNSKSTISVPLSSSASSFGQQSQKKQYLVYTNMHSEHINVVKEAIRKLGGFELEETVSSRTTHLVSLETRRTVNMLRGIIRGVWILKYDWIMKSLENGKWLIEEPFELREFSPAVEMCRSERQAFGSNYKIDLFSEVGPIYISSKCRVPSGNIKEMIKLCSGRVTDDKMRAKYIIGEKLQIVNNFNAICISPSWILDSITFNKLMKIQKYLINEK